MSSSFIQGGRLFGLVAVLVVAGGGVASAQISITAAEVALTQNFNSLPVSSVGGWTSNSTLTGVYAGGDSQITPAYRDGAIEKTSFGLNYTNPASDRALGMSLLGNINSDTVWYGFRYVNDSGVTLHSVQIAYFLERFYGWADESTRFAEAFRVYTAVNPSTTGNPSGPEWERRETLEYNLVGGPVSGSSGPANLASGVYYFDGNHADYRTELSASLNIAGGLAAGAEFWIMFGNSVAGVTDGKTISDGVAIDDLSVTFSTAAIPEPASATATLALGALACVTLRRRARK